MASYRDVYNRNGPRLREIDPGSRNLGATFLNISARGHLGPNSLIKRACRRKEKSPTGANVSIVDWEREREGDGKKGFRIFCIHFLRDEELRKGAHNPKRHYYTCKLGMIGVRFGDYGLERIVTNCNHLPFESAIYTHEIHQTYCLNFKVLRCLVDWL